MSFTLLNARYAMPAVYFRLLPTMHISARSPLTVTSPNAFRSSRIADSAEGLSKVSETDPSEVATISTDVRCLSKTANNAPRKPWAISIREDDTVTAVMPRLHAIDLIKFLQGRASF